MARFIKKISKTAGLSPGALVYVGDAKENNVKITVIDYDPNNLVEKEVKEVQDCFPFKNTSTMTWINIDGLHNIAIIEKLGQHFEVHPLVLEDILNTSQRPKYDDFEAHIFVVLKMIMFDEKAKVIVSEQVSIIFGENFVISFQEKQGDVFDSIRTRIRNNKGRIRKMGADYLAYALMDAIVDSYYVVLEKMGDKIELMGEGLVINPDPHMLQKIHKLKNDAIYLRKSVWPLREVVSGLERGESALIKRQTHIFLKDLYDHTIQVIDTIETFRDMISGMVDIYMSSLSNKMNEVMKVLTMIATIFIPMTFIAGIYGMNFSREASPWNMPELGWKYGYAGVWAVMLCVAAGMIMFFKRKKWL
ncbi:MAG: magnesium/cobalt transporter CorA [Candidatus Omnitrophica bacterium]|nr:magnesium/cobalt transporter CorA [Candidatus Omnitrophota bacterium]